jgi:hypothetical protein
VLNFELDFGPVLKSSGSNFGSGLNFSNTNWFANVVVAREENVPEIVIF